MKLAPLGELIITAGSRAKADSDLPVYAVTKHAGFVPSLEYFKKQVFSRDTSGYKIVEPGDFAYATIHLDEGSIGIAPERCLISPMYTVFRADSALVDPAYLIRFLKSPRALAAYENLGRGAVHRRKAISLSALSELNVPLPALEEQRRTTALLNKADALRTKRRQVFTHLTTLTQAIFHEMFDSVEHEEPLGSVCTRITDGTHQSPTWETSGIPFLFISNISSGEINLRTQKFISEQTWKALTRSTPIEAGDVLYSTVGSYGTPAVVRTAERFAFQRHIAHLKPAHDLVHPEFLAAQLAGEAVKRQADRAARGIAQPTINLRDIKKFKIKLPEISHQLAFVDRITAIQRMRAAQAESARLADELLASLQSRAFRGEL